MHLRHDRRLVMIVLAFMLLPVFWYLRTDLALYAADGPHARARVLTRGALLVTGLAAMLLLRAMRSRRDYARIVFGVSLAVALYMIAISALQPPDAALPVRTALVLIFLLYVATPNSLWRQVLPPVLLSLGLVALRILRVADGAGGALSDDIQLLLILNVCGVILVRRRIVLEDDAERAWAAEHAARLDADRNFAELRTLRGIIPICSHCKQVRTDVGEWQEVERYVASHSDAQFSHGVCPSCFAEHYPDLSDLP